mgnify:CR=1 FL=1
MVVNNMDANKILDKYTGRQVSVSTATKRLSNYQTDQYDIFFPFTLGANIRYDPYLNRFINVSTLKQIRDIKRKDKINKQKERADIIKQKNINTKEKVKALRKEKVITKRQERKLLKTQRKQIAKDKAPTRMKQVLEIPGQKFGMRRFELKYNPNFKQFGKKNKGQRLADTKSILEDIDDFIQKKKKYMARIILYTPYANTKNTFSTKVSENPSIQEILDQIERILNSDESFDLGKSEIIVKFYDLPQGSAIDPIIPIPKWLKDKTKSVFLINNTGDKLCGQRCLVLGMANADRKKYLRRKNCEALFKREAEKIGNVIGVNGSMNFLDFNKFCIKYPKYKVSIVSDLNTILYETENKDYEEEIWLYYDKRIEHYHYVNSIDGFFNDKNGHYKFCKTCRKRLEKRVYDKHKCQGLKCNLCGMTFSTEEEKQKHLKCKSVLTCSNCNLKCRGEECLDRHQNGYGKRKGCKGDQWFFPCCLEKGYSVMECWGRKEDREHHKCDHKYCKVCEEYKPRNHRCWIKPREMKDKGLVSLIAFDFESFIDDNTGEHSVNYIVAQERGTNKRWEWSYEEGKDILKEFIEFVFTKPKTTFIAHNGKAYDTWLIHYYITKHFNERPTKIILAGQKIMYMEIKSVKFIDSLNHFACRLEQVPKTFGLDESQFKKGFYPYIFNTKENWNYSGDIPDIKYFDPCSMSPNKRLEFLKWWYEKKQSGYIWNHILETKGYCISDVDILLQGCNVYSQEGMDLVGIDPLEKQTIASWVMDIYRKKFYDFDKSPICVLYKNEYDFIRKSFHGGRTETFRLYRKWSQQELKQGICGRYKDVQSLYPTTQFYDPLPIGEPTTITDFSFLNKNEYHNYITNNYGWYEVDINMNKHLFIPPLVVKGEGKLTADLNNKEKAVFHSVELQRAIEDGCVITNIYKCIQMNSSTDLFKDFVRTFLEVKVNATGKPKFWDSNIKRNKWIKEHEDRFGFTPNPTEKNAGKRAIAKMILNSLWGKFGQRPDMPKNLYIPPDNVDKWYKMLKDCKDGKIDIKGEELSGDCLFVSYMELDENKNDTLKSTSIAIASSVTACATMRLYKELRLLKQRVFYCDTDSVIYEHDPNKYNIPDGEFLGEWECETDGLPITEFVSTGPKSYAYKVQGKVKDCKMKGITLNWENSKDINFNNLKKLVDKDTPKLTTKQNIRFDKNKDKGITTFQMTKDIQFTMDKRIVKDYWTYPFGYEGATYN